MFPFSHLSSKPHLLGLDFLSRPIDKQNSYVAEFKPIEILLRLVRLEPVDIHIHIYRCAVGHGCAVEHAFGSIQGNINFILAELEALQNLFNSSFSYGLCARRHANANANANANASADASANTKAKVSEAMHANANANVSGYKINDFRDYLNSYEFHLKVHLYKLLDLQNSYKFCILLYIQEIVYYCGREDLISWTMDRLFVLQNSYNFSHFQIYKHVFL
jgi:hypothetical protein